MEAVASQDEQVLLGQLAQIRERTDELARDLGAIDAELEGMAKDRHEYRLLGEACDALEALGEIGAAGLFWGEGVPQSQRDEHVRDVRRRVDVFEHRIREIEQRRQAVGEKLRSEQENAEILEDEVFEARDREEQRKLEWVVERELGPLPGHPSVMPWARGGEDEERLRKTMVASLLVALVLSFLLPLVDLPIPDPWEPIDVPERLARLIRENRPLPPPPVREQTPLEAAEPEPIEETVPVAEEGSPNAESQETPKPSAASKGILAFREKFSGLAETSSAARLGAQARIRTSGEPASGRPERSMVATQAPGSSGGINLAGLSRDVGGGGGGDQIEGVQVTRATSSIGSVSGSGRPLSGGPGLGRTDEEIQIVFDRYKAALYRLYNRELRRDPTLKGQMVLRIRIEPDGSVTLCEMQSTNMKAPQLVSRVVDRVGTFDFGAKDGVPTVTILYPIDFLPAT